MKYTLSELKREVYKDVYGVYEIFQDFFGEQFVDLQFKDGRGDIPFEDSHIIPYGVSLKALSETDLTESQLEQAKNLGQRWIPSIYVWWPTVTVTNENDRSIQIKDLYAKIDLSLNGTIPYEYDGFRLLRSTFPYLQFKEGYVHSHVPRLYPDEIGAKEWRSPCLGSGPIRKTILDLHNNNEDALWMLFCQELSLYVTVESLTGGPYFRMEELGTGTYMKEYEDYNLNTQNITSLSGCFYGISSDTFKAVIEEFTKYYLENGHFTISYKNRTFMPGMPFFDFIVDISNCFIEWYNSQSEKLLPRNTIFNKCILVKATTSNRKFYKKAERTNNTDFTNLEGTSLLTFKGRDITLHIEPNIEDTSSINNVLLLDSHIASYIISNILKVINYRYENKHTKEHRGNQEETSSTYRKVCYI